MTRLPILTAVGLLLAVSLVTGCADGPMPTYRVTGRVTLDGEPLAGAIVMFRPEKGPLARGETDAEGRYELTTHAAGDGAIVGKHAVSIVPASQTFDVPPEELDMLVRPPKVAFSANIPARYQSAATSGQTAEIQADDNQHDLMLFSDK